MSASSVKLLRRSSEQAQPQGLPAYCQFCAVTDMELGWLSQMLSLVAMAHGSSNLSLSPPTAVVAGWIMANVQVRVMVLPFHKLGAWAVSPVFLWYPAIANDG